MLVVNGMMAETKIPKKNAEYLAMLEESEKQIAEGKTVRFTEAEWEDYNNGHFTKEIWKKRKLGNA